MRCPICQSANSKTCGCPEDCQDDELEEYEAMMTKKVKDLQSQLAASESESSALRKQLSEAPYNELIQYRQLAADNESEIEALREQLSQARKEGFEAARVVIKDGDEHWDDSSGNLCPGLDYKHETFADYRAQLTNDKGEG